MIGALSSRSIRERLQQLRETLDGNVGIDRAYWQINESAKDGVPHATVEALVFSLPERGPAALREPQTRRRIGAISEQQLHEVCGRLRSWSDNDVRLVEPWTKDHE